MTHRKLPEGPMEILQALSLGALALEFEAENTARRGGRGRPRDSWSAECGAAAVLLRRVREAVLARTFESESADG